MFLQRQHKAATKRLNKRIVEIYMTEQTSTLSVVLESSSFTELLDELDFLNEIGRQDEKVTNEVKRAKEQMQEVRNATRRPAGRSPRLPVRLPPARRSNAASATGSPADQRELATARRDKRATLANVREDKADALEHMRSLEAESASLAARIRSAQSLSRCRGRPGRHPQPASSGPFKASSRAASGGAGAVMHAGIDLAVPVGTPVVAAASGTVIVAGWLGGYGNLVVIDHGNGIATAYGHNTSVTVGVGQSVAQGQLISYSGSTGHSTGPARAFRGAHQRHAGGSARLPLAVGRYVSGAAPAPFTS